LNLVLMIKGMDQVRPRGSCAKTVQPFQAWNTDVSLNGNTVDLFYTNIAFNQDLSVYLVFTNEWVSSSSRNHVFITIKHRSHWSLGSEMR